MGRGDDCVVLAEHPNVILATFGDAIRVPGSRKSLLQAKADGADVRIVYSPLDALKIARDHPDKEVVFFALGFETTMPSTAVTVLQAEREGIRNFSLLCNHITIIATIKAILDSPELTLDGFLGPGHASMVIGTVPYGFIAEHYGSRSSSPGSSGSTFCSQSQWFYVSSPRNAASSRTNTGASCPRPATAPG